jgi:outer membrane protein
MSCSMPRSSAQPRSAPTVRAPRKPQAFAVCCLLFAVSQAGAVRAQNPAAPRSMSLDDALSYARAHQPAIEVAQARLLAQRTAADVPRSQWLPTLGVTAQLFAATANNTTGTYVSPDSIDIPRIGATHAVDGVALRPYARTLAAVGVRQELFDSGRIAAQAALEDARSAVELEHARATQLDVVFNVEEAYFAVLTAKAVIKASDEALERSRAHRDYAKAGVDAGMRSPIELTRADADLARFEIGLLRAEGGLALAQITFAANVGVDDPALDVAGAPAAPPDLPALNDAIRRAAERDPNLQMAIAQLRAEEQHARAIGSELRPDLSLSGTLSTRAGGATPSGNGSAARDDGFVPNVPNWDVGVVFNWPLFDGSVQARVSTARAHAQVARSELRLVRHDEIAQIRLAYGNVSVAKRALPSLERSVEASHANYAQADARFRAGLGTSVELADAEAVRVDAEIQLALGQFALARARAAFGRVSAEAL